MTPDLLTAPARPRVEDNCTGCGACVPGCPARALSLISEHPGGRGRKAATVDAVRCTACGACLPACARQALVIAGRREAKAGLCK